MYSNQTIKTNCKCYKIGFCCLIFTIYFHSCKLKIAKRQTEKKMNYESKNYVTKVKKTNKKLKKDVKQILRRKVQVTLSAYNLFSFE